MQELNKAIEETFDDEMLHEIAAEHSGGTDDDFPMMLDLESEDRFLDLSAHLLPFEEPVVTDGWLAIQRLVAGGNLSTDIDDSYEEAKHRFGIIERLPAPDESEKSGAEQLRLYLKNKRNRERYAEEITELKNRNLELHCRTEHFAADIRSEAVSGRLSQLSASPRSTYFCPTV